MSGARSRSTSRVRRPTVRESSPEEEHSSGILSNIFSYVSREVKSFVVSAKGGQEEVSRSHVLRSMAPSLFLYRDLGGGSRR